MKRDEVFPKADYKANMSRQWHAFERACTISNNWTKLRFSHTYLALETDALTDTHIKKVMFKFGQNDGLGRTAAEKSSKGENAIKHMGINALCCAVMFLSDCFNRKKLRCVVSAAQPLEKWYREERKFCRDMSSNAQWWIRQCNDGFMEHVHDAWDRLHVSTCKLPTAGIHSSPLHLFPPLLPSRLLWRPPWLSSLLSPLQKSSLAGSFPPRYSIPPVGFLHDPQVTDVIGCRLDWLLFAIAKFKCRDRPR